MDCTAIAQLKLQDKIFPQKENKISSLNSTKIQNLWLTETEDIFQNEVSRGKFLCLETSNSRSDN